MCAIYQILFSSWHQKQMLIVKADMCVYVRVCACEDIHMYVGIHYTILYFCILLKMSVLGAREMAQWL